MRTRLSCCVKHRAAADPTPAGALAPLHDRHLPARHRRRGDYLHRPRPARTDDACPRRPGPVEHHPASHHALPRPATRVAPGQTIAPHVTTSRPPLGLAWECGHGVVDRAAVTRVRLGSCGALGFTRCQFPGPCRGCPSKRRSGHPCPDLPSERGRCGARLLLHWLGADPVPERALVIERDGGRRHQLVIACRL